MSPWGWKTSSVENGNSILITAGSATQSPTVETSRTVGLVWVRRRNSAKYRNSPSSGATTRIVNGAATSMLHPFLVVR